MTEPPGPRLSTTADGKTHIGLDIGVNEDGQLEIKMEFSDPRFIAEPFKHALSRRQSAGFAAWIVAAHVYEDPAFQVTFEAAVNKLVRERAAKQEQAGQ